MGAPRDIEAANQVSYEYTSTKSIFTIEADDKVSVKVTFLSPLTPDDYKRQSLIFSYMQVEVSSKDGASHDVQLYTDISAGMVPLREFCDTTRATYVNLNLRMGFGRFECCGTVGHCRS
jgi:hypothetical protein